MQNNAKACNNGLKTNGTAAATHPLYNALHKHLKYLSTANDLQKDLQVSHPLLGQRDKSVKRVKSGRTSTQSTLHRDNVHTSASQDESACERESVKKWEDKARQNITSVLRANTHCERMFRIRVTDTTSPLYTIIITFLTLSSTVCLYASLVGDGEGFGGLREGMGREYATIKQTGAVRRMRVKREGGKTKWENKRGITGKIP